MGHKGPFGRLHAAQTPTKCDDAFMNAMGMIGHTLGQKLAAAHP
jgi:hypothetical protein